jgi:hypothetical protein
MLYYVHNPAKVLNLRSIIAVGSGVTGVEPGLQNCSFVWGNLVASNQHFQSFLKAPTLSDLLRD